MKIAFDVHPLLSDNKSGIGYCEYGFIKTLFNNYPDNKYIFNYFGRDSNNQKLASMFNNGKQKHKALLEFQNCKFFRNFIYQVIWNVIPIPYCGFFKKNADITHFFNYYLPPGVSGKTVVTVHDMAYKRFPEAVRLRTKKMLDINLKKSVNRADLIVTDSEFSKKEILFFFPECKEKVEIVYSGVDLDIFKPISSRSLKESVKKKYRLEEEFLLYLGTIEPRKNIERLLEAYFLLKKKTKDFPKLVLAGGKGWLESGIFNTLERLELKNDVVFTGYVSDEDVPVLMNMAKAFLFPSIYEGFGMPPLEAMACGVPVLTSNVASLPEVVGDAAVLVDPFSVDSILLGIEKIMYDETLRATLIQKGQERAKLFSWEIVTDRLYKLYEDLVHR